MKNKVISPNIIVALDFTDKKSAMDFVDRINPKLCRLKIGKGLFTRLGPDFVRALMAKGFSVFLDLKFHDIPNTVHDACSAAAELGVWMVNVHVWGGIEMLKAARSAIDAFPVESRPLLIGVTVLTSLDARHLQWTGLTESVESLVSHLATTAKNCGLDGVVCSAHEAALVRKQCGDDFLIVTPGIRLEDDQHQDQKRVMTPQAALAAGADYLVMGRSITQIKDPNKVLSVITLLSARNKHRH